MKAWCNGFSAASPRSGQGNAGGDEREDLRYSQCSQDADDNVDIFQSSECGCLGYVPDGKAAFIKTTERRHPTASEFAVADMGKLPWVDILYGYGSGSRDLADAVKMRDCGIVYAGVGDVGVSPSTYHALKEACKKELSLSVLLGSAAGISSCVVQIRPMIS